MLCASLSLEGPATYGGNSRRGALGYVVDLQSPESKQARELLRKFVGVLNLFKVGFHLWSQVGPSNAMGAQHLNDDRIGHGDKRLASSTPTQFGDYRGEECTGAAQERR